MQEDIDEIEEKARYIRRALWLIGVAFLFVTALVVTAL